VPEWFDHDYTATNDPKLQKIKVLYGNEGIGVYWQLVELMYQQNGKLQINDVEVLAKMICVKNEVLHSIIGIAFFKRGKNFSSKRVQKNISDRKKRSEIYRNNAMRKYQKGKPAIAKQLHSNSHAIHTYSMYKGGNVLKNVPPNNKPQNQTQLKTLIKGGYKITVADLKDCSLKELLGCSDIYGATIYDNDRTILLVEYVNLLQRGVKDGQTS